MGMDCYMSIVKDGKFIAKDIFDGRNTEWFNNLQDAGWSYEYHNLPIVFGHSSKAPQEWKDSYTAEKGYFGFYHFLVKYFKEWFEKYRPDRDAGWVSTYDKWRIENKGYIPDDVPHYLPEDARMEDMHFVEFANPYDCSVWLYNYLIENKIDDNADVTYCFDR